MREEVGNLNLLQDNDFGEHSGAFTKIIVLYTHIALVTIHDAQPTSEWTTAR